MCLKKYFIPLHLIYNNIRVTKMDAPIVQHLDIKHLDFIAEIKQKKYEAMKSVNVHRIFCR
jgi:hypothetical protein